MVIYVTATTVERKGRKQEWVGLQSSAISIARKLQLWREGEKVIYSFLELRQLYGLQFFLKTDEQLLL